MRSRISVFLDERGVSDVVGNMMMVTITIIMSAIIASAMFSLKPPPDVPHINIETEPNGTANVDLVHMGGVPVQVSHLKFMSEGMPVTINNSSATNYSQTWSIGRTITLDTDDIEVKIVHLPSKELIE